LYRDYQYALFNQAAYARIGISPFISTITKLMLSHVSNTSTSIGSPLFSFFSAHDNSIASILGYFNFDNFRWPPYASNIIFELWKSNSFVDSDSDSNYPGIFVRFLYNGQLLSLSSAGCSDPAACSLDQFLQYTNSLSSQNIDQQCQSKNY
jgi:acid phosphatase